MANPILDMFSSWGGRIIPSSSFFQSPAARAEMYEDTGVSIGTAADAWDFGDVDRYYAVAAVGLSEDVVSMSWSEIPNSWRRRLMLVIDRGKV